MREDIILKNVLRPCPVCASARAQVLHHQPFVLPSDHILPDSHEVVCCDNCGFVYTDTAATQSEYDRYYAQFSKYDDAQTSTGAGVGGPDADRLRETAQAIAGVLQNPEASILDAGCALGGLLHELVLAGFHHVRGLDPSPASAKYARESFGIEVFTDSITKAEMDFGDATYDCVILSHVLEHIRDVEAALANLRDHCKPGGVMYIEVPDAARYREFIVAPFQDFNIEHINHFSAVHLNQLAARFGFEYISGGSKVIQSSENSPYPALYAFYRLSGQEQAAPRPFSKYELRASIMDYIRLSTEMLAAMDQRLGAYCCADKEIVVWGTGQLTLKLLAQTALKQANIVCFLDGNPINHGKILRGIPVMAPEQWSLQNDGKTPILIATTIHQDAISNRIRSQLMWNNPLVTLK